MPADMEGIRRLIDVVDRLLGPGGCSWDQAQTLSTLRTYLLEEAYELLEAMEQQPSRHCEEVGDMLFQLAFQSAIRQRAGQFDLGQAADAAAQKLVRRHPHVFGGEANEAAKDAEPASGRVGQGERNWESLKNQEKKRESLMDDIPEELPALMQAEKVQRRAASAGFDWPDAAGAVEKIHEELAEFEQAMQQEDHRHLEEELGDLLFAVVNASRHVAVAPELALRKATQKFRNRFRTMERLSAAQGRSLYELNLDELERLWQEAKKIPSSAI